MSVPLIHKGMRLPYFRSGVPQEGDPSPFDSQFMSLLVAVCNGVLNFEVQEGPRNEFSITPYKAVLTLRRGASSGGSDGVTLASYVVKSVSDDHVTCRTWDGTTEGDEDVEVAKQPGARLSVATVTVSGQAWDADYVGNNERTITNQANPLKVLTQYLEQPYIVGEIIFAAVCSGPTGVDDAPDWLELQPLRRWEIKLVEWNVPDANSECVDHALFQSSEKY